MKKMIERKVLEDLVNSYNREGVWAKLEALYIISKEHRSFYSACKNIRIRYGTEEPAKEVEMDIKRLCGEKSVYSQTDDTNEEIGGILVTACEQAFPKFFTERVIGAIQLLSRITKRFIFLLYKEGSILEGEISTSDETILFHLTPAYEIIFEQLKSDEYKVLDEAVQEMVKAGLIDDCWWSSNKHDYFKFIVPPFAKEVWLNLPKYLPIPTIQVHESW